MNGLRPVHSETLGRTDCRARGVVVVTGFPGSGKSLVAGLLGSELGIPVISKDQIKIRLWEFSPQFRDLDSRSLGRFAIEEMFSSPRQFDPVILDSFFWPGLSESDLLLLERPLVQVHCNTPIEVCIKRFREREVQDRHTALRDPSGPEVSIGRWSGIAEGPLQIPGPLYELDTSSNLDIVAASDFVRDALSQTT